MSTLLYSIEETFGSLSEPALPILWFKRVRLLFRGCFSGLYHSGQCPSLLSSTSPQFAPPYLQSLLSCPAAVLDSHYIVHSSQYIGMEWTGKGISTRCKIVNFFFLIVFLLVLLSSTIYQPTLCLHLIQASSQQSARHSKHDKLAGGLGISHCLPS